MCVRYCAAHPENTGCTCDVQDHSIIREIYDMNVNGVIERDEFNALVNAAETNTIEWPTYSFT